MLFDGNPSDQPEVIAIISVWRWQYIWNTFEPRCEQSKDQEKKYKQKNKNTNK